MNDELPECYERRICSKCKQSKAVVLHFYRNFKYCKQCVKKPKKIGMPSLYNWRNVNISKVIKRMSYKEFKDIEKFYTE